MLSPQQKQRISGTVIGWIAAIIVIAVIVGIAKWQQNKKQPTQYTNSHEEVQPIQEECKEQTTPITRNDTLRTVLDTINEMAPQKAAPQARWSVTQVEFVNDQTIYTQYTDGTTTQQLLGEVKFECLTLKHQEIGYFKQEGLLWKIVRGEDAFAGRELNNDNIIQFYEEEQEWLTKTDIEERLRVKAEEERKKQEEEQAALQQQQEQENDSNIQE